MAANSDPIFTLTPNIAGVQLTSASGTTVTDLITGGTNAGSMVFVVTCSTNDTTAVDVGFYIQRGGAGTNYFLGNVHLPPGSGYTTVAGVDAIAALPLTYARAITLNAGDKLRVACAAAMTAAKTTDIVALAGDF